MWSTIFFRGLKKMRWASWTNDNFFGTSKSTSTCCSEGEHETGRARVPLVTLNDCAKAAPIQRRLANAGIAAEIDDELLEKLWFVSKEESDARIDVPMDQLERAQKLLFEWDASEGILREAIRCPECRSLQVHSSPQFAHSSLIPNLMMGFLCQDRLFRSRRNIIQRTVITRGRKTEPSASGFCIRRKLIVFVDGIKQTMLRPKPAQSESTG